MFLVIAVYGGDDYADPCPFGCSYNLCDSMEDAHSFIKKYLDNELEDWGDMLMDEENEENEYAEWIFKGEEDHYHLRDDAPNDLIFYNDVGGSFQDSTHNRASFKFYIHGIPN